MKKKHWVNTFLKTIKTNSPKNSGENFDSNGHNILINTLNGLDTCIFISDADTHELLFYNRKTAEFFDIDETALGQPCWKIFRRTDKPCSFCNIPELKKNPSQKITWDEFVPEKGIMRHSEHLIMWDDGKYAHIQEFIDITDIKNAEMEYKKQLEQQQLMSCITQSFISDDDTQKCFYDAMEQTGIITESDHVSMVLFNAESSRLITGRQWATEGKDVNLFNDEFLNGDLKQSFINHFINKKEPYVIQNEIPEDLNPELRIKKIAAFMCMPFYINDEFIGALILTHETKKAWSDSDIRFSTLISHIFANIVSRQKIGIQLERLSKIVENLPSIIILLDENFDIEYSNPSLNKIIGYTDKEIEQNGVQLFLDAKTDSYLKEKVYPEVLSGKTIKTEVTVHKKDGGDVILEISAFLIPNGLSGKSIAFIAIDATEHIRLNEELLCARDAAENASSAKSTFLSNISHEIRTPMTAIMGMLDIAMKTDDVEHIKNCLKKMQTSSYHLLNILNDVLDMSKIESGTFEMFEEAFSLEKALSDLMIVIGVKANEKEQDILVNVNRDVPVFLYGDAMRLSQIIINLISNAIKFSPKWSKVYLDVVLLEKGEKDVLLGFSVKDEGIGMSKEKIEMIFQPFKQADSSITKRYGGTGLGLSISKNIIEHMNGTISVISEEGNGSTFSFTARFKIATISEKRDDWHYKGKVLIVDDSQVTRSYIGKLLAEHDIAYTEAHSGQKAIDIVKKEKIDLAVIDYRMLGIDGIQTAIALKEISQNEIKIALTSISDMMKIYDDAKKAGVDYFLQKPILNSTLGDMFTAIQDNSKRRRYKNDFGPADFSGKNFLVVEDSLINREIARFILEEAGGNVTEAENGEIAVDMFYKNPTGYDCILMDIQMPVMDGYTATGKIRGSKLPSCMDIPIIAMTANVFSEDVAASMKAELNAHIAKPINTAEMYRIIKEHIH